MTQETEAFEVIVGTNITGPTNIAIAQAARELSHIHEFQNGEIFDVNTYGGESEPFGIGLCFDTDIQMGDDYGLKKFMDSCTAHHAVESVERIHHESA